MNRLTLIASLCGLSALPLLAARPEINDKKAPSGRQDLEQIQSLLKQVLPDARKATVCIELGQGSGSGVVVSEDGLILTAAHVTGGVGKEFTVRFEDGRSFKAKSLGLNSETDAAIAKIVDKGSYPFVPIEREDRTRLGDWVFSLGHSGGFDEDRGSVVRLGRIVRVADSTYQSDCNLIGGDSGGPLFDLEGKLIGIHSRVGQRLPENMHVPMREYLSNWDKMMGGEFMGEGLDFLSVQNILWGNFSLSIGAILICLFVGWKWGTKAAAASLEENGDQIPAQALWEFLVKYVCPLAVGAILVYIVVTGNYF